MDLLYEVGAKGYRWSLFMTAMGTYDMTVWNSTQGYTSHGQTIEETVRKVLEWISTQ